MVKKSFSEDKLRLSQSIVKLFSKSIELASNLSSHGSEIYNTYTTRTELREQGNASDENHCRINEFLQRHQLTWIQVVKGVAGENRDIIPSHLDLGFQKNLLGFLHENHVEKEREKEELIGRVCV